VSGGWLNRNDIHDLYSVIEKRHGKQHLRSVTENRHGNRHGKHDLCSVMEKRNILCLPIYLDT